MRLIGLVHAGIVSLCIVACSGGGGGSSTGPDNNTNSNPGTNNNNPQNTDNSAIIVSNNSYSPTSKTISTGMTVNWSWNSCGGGAYGDDICTDHTVTFDDGVTSETQSKGSFTRTFTKAGTYKYHCQIHGTAMSGTITVQ